MNDKLECSFGETVFVVTTLVSGLMSLRRYATPIGLGVWHPGVETPGYQQGVATRLTNPACYASHQTSSLSLFEKIGSFVFNREARTSAARNSDSRKARPHGPN